MADRVRSDHPSIPTARGRLARHGGTRRLAVEVPAGVADSLPEEGTVRLVVDGRARHAPIDRVGDGRGFAGAYGNPRRARERDGTDRLVEWVDANGLDGGRSVLVDEVEPGEVYGLRMPGEETVYQVSSGPGEALRRIAEDLES